MGWNLTDLEAAHPNVPARLVREYYRARQQEASGASRARKEIEKITGEPFGEKKA